MALSSTPAKANPNKIIEDAVNHFFNVTHKMLYFVVEQMAVREYGDGFQVSYIVTDEEGEKRQIFVTLENGSLRCERFDRLIKGIDSKGQPVHGTHEETSAMFYSSLNLLLQGITEWSLSTGIDADIVVCHFEMQNKVRFDRKESRNGKTYIFFS